MTNKQKALVKSAYADANLGADMVSRFWSHADEGRDVLQLDTVRNTRRALQSAVSSLTSLESLLAGNPEPKRGD